MHAVVSRVRIDGLLYPLLTLATHFYLLAHPLGVMVSEMIPQSLQLLLHFNIVIIVI